MEDLRPIEPAQHILEIDYAVRGPLEEIALELEASGKEVIHLNIGDPARFGMHKAPMQLTSILLEKLEEGRCFQYGSSAGNPEIRRTIAEKTRHIKGVNGGDVTENDVYIGNGSSELITFCIKALLNLGEGILIPDPGYPLYSAVIREARGESQFYSLDEGDSWRLTEKSLEKAVRGNTKAIVVINPNNPTGRNYIREELQMVRRFADRHRLLILADEVYSHLNYNGNGHIPLAMLDGDYPVITFCSLSKNYLAPGFRVGWMVRTDPHGLTQKGDGKGYWDTAISKLASVRLCPSTLMQYAIIPAITDDSTLKHTLESGTDSTFTDHLKRNAELTYRKLNDAAVGISCVKPQAGFYAFPKIELPEGKTDFDFAKSLLINARVYVNNGSGFGPGGAGHLRVVFLPEFNVLKEAYSRLIEFKNEYR